MSQGFTKGTPIDTDPNLSLNSDIVVPSQKAVKTYVDGGLSDKVNRSGDTMSGFLVLNANPLAPLGAATKDYVDTLINGLDWKQAADAGTVAALPTYNVTGSGQVLTGTANGAIPSATTDGVTLAATQRVLVKNETLTRTPNNGIYVVTQVGSATLPFILTRASDANTSALISEATLSVKAGTTLANTQWHCNPATIPIIIGTTNITFAQIGGGTYTFSPPLTVAGNIVSIPVATSLVDGYLSAADWTNFNTAYTNRITSLTTTGSSGAATLISNTLNIPDYTLSGLGGVPTSRTLTINGTALDLSADRSWSVGTVTSVAGAGTAFGLTLTGTVTGSGNITLGGTLAVPIANITATGTPSATTFLRGDGSWATPAGGGGGTATIGATIDGSGGTITVGQKGYVQIPYACTINSWRIIANASGSIVIDITKAAAPTIPTVSITGSALPTLTAPQQTNASSTLTGWTTSVAANDIIGFNVNSATTVSWVIIQLFVTKL